MSKTTVLYHGGCLDGFTAAWFAKGYLPEDTEFIPVYYGQEPPLTQITGRHVYILDFSYKRPVMQHIAEAANSLVVLDHHSGVEKELHGLQDELGMRFRPTTITIVEGKSGARLTAEYFSQFEMGGYMQEGPKFLIDYTEDRDLWRWKLPYSKEINAWLRIQDMTFERWGEIAHAAQSPHFIPGIRIAGDTILGYQSFLVKRYCKHAKLVKFEGYEVPIVNCADPLIVSEVGHSLCELYHFSLTYFIREDGKFVFSLRSREGGADVSEIARKHGGGGHKHAASFELSVDKVKVLGIVFPPTPGLQNAIGEMQKAVGTLKGQVTTPTYDYVRTTISRVMGLLLSPMSAPAAGEEPQDTDPYLQTR